jgi:hypothetical protein
MYCGTLRHSQAVPIVRIPTQHARPASCSVMAIEHQSLMHELFFPTRKGSKGIISILAQPFRELTCESLAPVGVSAAHTSTPNRSWMPLGYFRSATGNVSQGLDGHHCSRIPRHIFSLPLSLISCLPSVIFLLPLRFLSCPLEQCFIIV